MKMFGEDGLDLLASMLAGPTPQVKFTTVLLGQL